MNRKTRTLQGSRLQVYHRRASRYPRQQWEFKKWTTTGQARQDCRTCRRLQDIEPELDRAESDPLTEDLGIPPLPKACSLNVATRPPELRSAQLYQLAHHLLRCPYLNSSSSRPCPTMEVSVQSLTCHRVQSRITTVPDQSLITSGQVTPETCQGSDDR